MAVTLTQSVHCPHNTVQKQWNPRQNKNSVQPYQLPCKIRSIPNSVQFLFVLINYKIIYCVRYYLIYQYMD